MNIPDAAEIKTTCERLWAGPLLNANHYNIWKLTSEAPYGYCHDCMWRLIGKRAKLKCRALRFGQRITVWR